MMLNMNTGRNVGAIALLLAGILLPGFAAAEIYKCTNARGEVEYQGIPCDDGRAQETVRERQPNIMPSDPEASPRPSAGPADNTPETAWSSVQNAKAWLRAKMDQYHLTGLHLVLLVYLVMSLVSFFTYRYDKQVAIDDIGRRVSENTMHWQEALGGWPGAWIAQRVLRHKTIKPSYQAVFWLIVFSHVLLWIDYLRGFPWLRGLFDLLR